MSIFEYFIFCMQTTAWAAPALTEMIPIGLLADEI